MSGVATFDQWYKHVCDYMKSSGGLQTIEVNFSKQIDDQSRVIALFNLFESNAGVISTSFQKKSTRESENFRNAGNKLFVKKDYKAAVKMYSKSISHAKCDSVELSLAYGNRSAVLIELEEYNLCKKDIDLAFSCNYPLNLCYKLFERAGKCDLKLGNMEEAVAAFETSLTKLNDSELKLEKKNDKCRSLVSLMKQCKDMKSKTIKLKVNDMNAAYHVSVPKLDDVSQTFPYASKSFGIVDEAGKGRHAIALNDIEAGEVIIVEKPYTSICLPDRFESHCYNCLKRFVVGYPCRQCTEVMYCSSSCLENSWTYFHQYECEYLTMLTKDDIGLGHLALKMIALTGLEQLRNEEKRDAHLRSIKNRIYGLNENNIYNPSDYHCVYSLIGNSELRSSADLFRRTLLALFLCHVLAKSNFFLEATKENVCLVATHLLKQIQMLPCNAHEVSELQLQGTGYADSELTEIGSAVYTTLSLLNHSCDPSVVRHCYGDTCVLRAVKYIPAGEQIIDNYGFIYAVEEKAGRQKHILEQYYFNCSCVPCVNDWPLYNELNESQPKFNCISCEQLLAQDSNTCTTCEFYHDELEDFSELQKKFQSCMENVLDSGDVRTNLPVLLKYLNIFSKYAVLPAIQLNNCQEIVKLCFSMQANFVRL